MLKPLKLLWKSMKSIIFTFLCFLLLPKAYHFLQHYRKREDGLENWQKGDAALPLARSLPALVLATYHTEALPSLQRLCKFSFSYSSF